MGFSMQTGEINFNVGILLGNGSGAFTAMPSERTEGGNPLALADLDRDGKADLVASFGWGVDVYRGSGSSGPSGAIHYPIDRQVMGIAVVDLNGDGWPDIALLAQENARVLWNDGSGGFPRRTGYEIGHSFDSLRTGDVDGDGRRDLVATSSVGTSVVFTGAAGPLAAVDFPAPASVTRCDAVAMGDLDDDGEADLALATSYPAGAAVFLNTNGTFGPAVAYELGGAVTTTTTSIAIGDVNGDRRPDLVLNQQDDSAAVLINDGTGTFGTPTGYAAGGALLAVVLSDLDGDGDADLVGSTRSGINVLMNDGTGVFGAPTPYTTTAVTSPPVLGDLNGDGKLDVAVASWELVDVLYNKGDGTLLAATAVKAGTTVTSIAIADLDADTRPDIAIADGGNRVGCTTVGSGVRVLFNDGSQAFTAIDYVTRGAFGALAIADLDRDGKPDIVTANILMLRNEGNRIFRVHIPDNDAHYVSNLRTTHSLAVGDVNGDGKPDLAFVPTPYQAAAVIFNSSP
jgi:hypothetical protein